MEFGAEMAKPRSSVHSSKFGDWTETDKPSDTENQISHLITVGVGSGNNEVISSGAGEKIVRLGECGDKEAE